jgi:hypothetical protein
MYIVAYMRFMILSTKGVALTFIQNPTFFALRMYSSIVILALFLSFSNQILC